MRLRTAFTATVLAAVTVLGGAGLASANGVTDGWDDNDVHVIDDTTMVTQFGDMVLD
ncbi:hypothetical protein ACIRF8_10315 [Streptomyces sp. NPDC102406]|uniref:hypothetical protein n=1 Tax=Streptomyces sp. NPDC102406 TaxID=3366171 RepID=UPI0038297A30